jgi:cytochrome c oxidase cbb3-type subunit 2
VDHLTNPQSVVPESVMPKYGFLMNNVISPESTYIAEVMATNRFVGVPYSDEQMEMAVADFWSQVDPDGNIFEDADPDALLERYPGAQTRNFDGQPEVTEMDAIIAYMQVLGTMVDFSTFEPVASR